ncbi:MAG: Bax inhibitor-1/YccA family protein [Candidatus Babeliales bacterium]
MHEDYPITSRIHSFMYSVYAWMTCALLLSAFTAYYISATPTVFNWIYSNTFVLIIVVVAQIGLVIGLSLWLPRLSLLAALVMFFAYAGLLGVTLSIIFKLYTTVSIFATFITAGGMFGAMALYGYMTRTDLTTVGNISVMILFGLIIALLVNLFLKSATVDLIISGIGVIIFSLLTAYDTQKLKKLAQRMLAEQETMQKVAVLGALMLYLDFINLFLFLLRFMGRQREG